MGILLSVAMENIYNTMFDTHLFGYTRFVDDILMLLHVSVQTDELVCALNSWEAHIQCVCSLARAQSVVFWILPLRITTVVRAHTKHNASLYASILTHHGTHAAAPPPNVH